MDGSRFDIPTVLVKEDKKMNKDEDSTESDAETSSENAQRKEICVVDVMLASLSDQISPQELEAKAKSILKRYRGYPREGDWLKRLEDTLQNDLPDSELRQNMFEILLQAHASDFELFLKTSRNRNEILKISVGYVLNVGNMQTKATILNIAARELQEKVGKKNCYVWAGIDYRDKKDGVFSLVCFYGSDLREQTSLYLGLPVLYKEWNTIEYEPLENCLSEEYRQTYFTHEQQNSKNTLLDYHTVDLFEQHSNLEAVSASSVISSKTRGLVKTPSIVLYCRFKGVIPVGESDFPKELRVNDIVMPTDVREGFFTIGMNNQPINSPKPTEFQRVLKMGSSIGREGVKIGGTLGPFVKDDQGNIGFITCAHVVGIDRQSTINQNIVQPADSDVLAPDGRDRVCGQITNIFFNHDTPVGIDAALVTVDTSKRDIDPVSFAWNNLTQLDVAGFHHEERPPSLFGGDVRTEISFQDVEGRRVIKSGSSTGFKKGSIALDGLSVRIYNSSLTFPTSMPWMSNVNVVMRGQFLVECSGTPFFDLGDSGAGVYLVEHQQNKLSLIGLAIGMLNESYCVVTPIRYVLQALGLRPEDVLSSVTMDIE